MRRANFRALVARMLPPVVYDVVQELRNHHTLRFFEKTFVGTFSTFDEVTKRFRDAVTYNSAESERQEVVSAARSKTEVRDARRGIAPPQTDHYALLCALTATLPLPSLTVLDIGGGTGEALAHLIYSCPRQKPRLIVKELTPIADAGRDVFKDETAISFIDDLADVRLPVDIVFLGSSLQYFENYQALLDEVAGFRPRMIVIAYTPMTDAPTFVTAQVNMRGRVIPNKVIHRTDIVQHMNARGFTLVHQSRSHSAAHFRNFPEPQRSSALSDMAFLAK